LTIAVRGQKPTGDAPDHWRPTKRAECVDGPRPCPYAGCRYHLYLDAKPCGSIRINDRNVALEDMEETCALDVAERGGATLEEVGDLLAVTYQAVQRIQDGARVRLGVLR
jgi:hypothetical protein